MFLSNIERYQLKKNSSLKKYLKWFFGHLQRHMSSESLKHKSIHLVVLNEMADSLLHFWEQWATMTTAVSGGVCRQMSHIASQEEYAYIFNPKKKKKWQPPHPPQKSTLPTENRSVLIKTNKK